LGTLCEVVAVLTLVKGRSFAKHERERMSRSKAQVKVGAPHYSIMAIGTITLAVYGISIIGQA
jgi:hypothetical protein